MRDSPRRRLDALLSGLGYGSRREVAQLCKRGRVRIEGFLATDASMRVDPRAVLLDDAPLDFPFGLVVALHKPLGVACTRAGAEGQTIFDLLPPLWRKRHPKVASAGRLDRDTSGLLVVTDDGKLIHRLTTPSAKVEKSYQATLDASPTEEMLERLRHGVLLDGERSATVPAGAIVVGPREVQITLREGKYHQVRRMFAAVGGHVEALCRIRIGALPLGDLPRGHWRAIAEAEIIPAIG